MRFRYPSAVDPSDLLRDFGLVAVWSLVFLLAAVLSVPGAAAAEEPASLLEALRSGETRVSLRYRLESVDDDRFGDDALASTLRTTLAYESAPFRRFTVFLEAENVTAVPDDDLYANAGAGSLNNRVVRPVVADPEITEVNQALLRWRSEATVVSVGRQEIALGDQRFVGPVGWRQNHQSFDGARAMHHIGSAESPRATVDYSYIFNVNRIFGDNRELDGHLLRVPIAVGPSGTLSPLAILLDYDDPAFAKASTATVGAELIGSLTAGDTRLSWEVEYAQQRDWGDNPRDDLDLAYTHLAGGADFGPLRIAGGIEWLEGDGISAFQTPLATLHKFDGWADLFLVTPANGLEAVSVGVSGSCGPIAWTGRYWDFSAESGGGDYGRELDLLASWKSDWGQTFAAKAAVYEEDGFGRDLTKLMLWTAWSFDTGS